MKCKTQLSKEIRDRIDEEVKREYVKNLDQYNREATVQLCYVLHFFKGYGMKRLKNFIKCMEDSREAELENYGFDEKETSWLLEKKLKDDGISIDEVMRIQR